MLLTQEITRSEALRGFLAPKIKVESSEKALEARTQVYKACFDLFCKVEEKKGSDAWRLAGHRHIRLF